MLSKKTCAALLVGMVLTPLAVTAANKKNFDVQLSASVPDDVFYVIPTADWKNGEKQVFSYNPDTERFTPFNKQLIIMSTSGAVTAKLSYQALLGGGAGTVNIPLAVTIDGTALDTGTAAGVASAEEAKLKKTVNLNITPNDPGVSGYSPGEYEGSVSMLFEVDPG